jgi:hypothetical protein
MVLSSGRSVQERWKRKEVLTKLQLSKCPTAKTSARNQGDKLSVNFKEDFILLNVCVRIIRIMNVS